MRRPRRNPALERHRQVARVDEQEDSDDRGALHERPAALGGRSNLPVVERVAHPARADFDERGQQEPERDHPEHGVAGRTSRERFGRVERPRHVTSGCEEDKRARARNQFELREQGFDNADARVAGRDGRQDGVRDKDYASGPHPGEHQMDRLYGGVDECHTLPPDAIPLKPGETGVGTLKARRALPGDMQPRDLSAHAEYRAGRGIEEVARELGRDPSEFVKLASNENPIGPSPAAVEAIKEVSEEVHHYPTAAHADLTEALAANWGVTPEQVWLSPGADGAFDYLSRAMLSPDERVLAPDPGFAYYAMSARYHHGEVNTYELEKREGFAQTAEGILDAYDGERIVFVTTPHNPTGSTCSLSDIEEIAARTDEETLVVVDEAYAEFAAGESAIGLVRERDDVAITRTFSKAYGLAGLRLGYAVVPDAWADAYARVSTPFAASEVACRAGLAALNDDEHVERTVELAEEGRKYIAEHADAPAFESQGNFVLLEVGDASRVSEEMKREGVIVRDCSSFGLPECIRITCGTEAETEKAVETLNEVL